MEGVSHDPEQGTEFALGAFSASWRYLRPAAALVQPGVLLRGQVCAVSERGVEAWLTTDQLPASVELEDYPEELWAATPLMMHAHLESFDAPSEEWPRASFAEWVQALLAWRMGSADRDSAAVSAQRSLAELTQSGCGLVLSSVSEPGAVVAERAHDQAKALLWPELFEPDSAQAQEVWQAFLAQNSGGSDADEGKESQAGRGPSQTEGSLSGVALHAPFSVSSELARLAFGWLQESNRHFLSIHLGEHADERALLREQSGPLAELLRVRGRRLPERRWDSPVEWLEDHAPGVQSRVLAVHASNLNEGELRAIQAKRVSPVFCPGTHQYFGRPRPAFADAGLPAPLIGCDSRASNPILSPMRELRLARALLPEYSAQGWWEAATSRAAQFLGWEARWGSLLPGTEARFLRFPDEGLRDAAALCDSLLSPEGPDPLGSPFTPRIADEPHT